MIVEILLYLFTPCPRWSRKAGYLRESIAIGARHSRVSHAWAEHLSQSRAAVLRAADQAVEAPQERREIDSPSKGRRLLVAGSGHGFDLPLETLATQFDDITLVDCVHPWRMRIRALFAARRARVRLVHADVTAKHGPDFTESGFDVAVSLNLISQLGVAPAKKQAVNSKASEDGDAIGPQDNGDALKLAHLTWMRARSAQAWVVGDAFRVAQAGSYPAVPEALLQRDSLDQWNWNLAPEGEMAARQKLETTVRVWRL